MGGWMDGWVGGWVDGSQSRVKDCLQQSKIKNRKIWTSLIRNWSKLIENPHRHLIGIQFSLSDLNGQILSFQFGQLGNQIVNSFCKPLSIKLKF